MEGMGGRGRRIGGRASEGGIASWPLLNRLLRLVGGRGRGVMPINNCLMMASLMMHLLFFNVLRGAPKASNIIPVRPRDAASLGQLRPKQPRSHGDTQDLIFHGCQHIAFPPALGDDRRPLHELDVFRPSEIARAKASCASSLLQPLFVDGPRLRWQSRLRGYPATRRP